MRDHRADIAALLRSGHVEAGGALPLSQRVQTSGRGEPQLPRSSEAAERAQRILGRGYAEGGHARRCALALWLLYGDARPLGDAPGLLLALALTLDEATRLERVRAWDKWGVGKSAHGLTASGAELIGRAIGWYQDASEEPGCAGVFAQLVTAADVAHGALARARTAQRLGAGARAKVAKKVA